MNGPVQRRPPSLRIGEDIPDRAWDRVIMAPNWSPALDAEIIAGRPCLVVVSEHVHNPHPHAHFAYLSVEYAHGEADWLSAIETAEAVLAIPETRSGEFNRYELAFRHIRARLRRRQDGPYSTTGSLLSLLLTQIRRRGWRSAVAGLRWALLLLWPLLGLAALISRPGGPRHIIQAWRDLWKWRPVLSGNYRVHRWWFRIMLGFAWACLRNRRLATQGPSRSLLVAMPDLIGDTITALPLVAELRRLHPDARISLLCSSKSAPVVRLSPHVDEIIAFDQPHPHNHHLDRSLAASKGDSQMLRDLRGRRFDIVYCPSYWTERSDLLNALDARQIIVPDMVSLLAFGATRIDVASHPWVYDRCLSLAGLPVPARRAALWPLPAASRQLRQGLLDSGKRLLIGIQSQAPLAPRRFPAAMLRRAIAAALGPRPYALLVFDRKDADWSAWSDGNPGLVAAWPGELSLEDAITHLGACDMLVANEGGMGHIAGTFSIPSVLVFTSTSPDHWLPWAAATAVPPHDVPCWPCYRNYCPWTLHCHAAIDPSRLEAAIAEVAAAMAPASLPITPEPPASEPNHER